MLSRPISHCDLRMRWRMASNLWFGAEISEPQIHSFCRNSGDLAPSTREWLAIAIVLFWCAKLWSHLFCSAFFDPPHPFKLEGQCYSYVPPHLHVLDLDWQGLPSKEFRLSKWHDRQKRFLSDRGSFKFFLRTKLELCCLQSIEVLTRSTFTL